MYSEITKVRILRRVVLYTKKLEAFPANVYIEYRNGFNDSILFSHIVYIICIDV